MVDTPTTEEKPMYQCAACGVAVVVLDGREIIRACEHDKAPIIANLTATMYGEGGAVC